MRPHTARHCRPPHRLAPGACCLLLACAAPASAQLALEFKSSEYRGRIDRPSTQNVWLVGDDNGDGVVDDNESIGPIVSIEDVFLNNANHSGLYSNSPALGSAAQTGNGAPGFGLNTAFSNYGSVPLDYPDYVQLPASYQATASRMFAQFDSAHLMRVFTFEGDPESTLSTANETVELGFGTRFLSGFSDHRFSNFGGLLGESGWDSSIQTESIGPQASLWWTLEKGPWQARVGGTAAMTYMDIEGDQRVKLGPDLVPGQYNRPLYFTPVQTDNHFESWEMAPVLEAGVRVSYDISPTVQGFVRGDLLQFSEIRDARDAIIHELPRMGVRDPGGYDVTVTAYSIGIEVRR